MTPLYEGVACGVLSTLLRAGRFLMNKGYSAILALIFYILSFENCTRMNGFNAFRGSGNAFVPTAVATPAQRQVRIQISYHEKSLPVKSLLRFSYQFWLRKLKKNIVTRITNFRCCSDTLPQIKVVDFHQTCDNMILKPSRGRPRMGLWDSSQPAVWKHPPHQ
jgi:hypothetical protein